MIRFSVPEMNCNHCEATIEKAIKSVDEAATIESDLAEKTVAVEGGLDEVAIIDAIRDAGYEARAIR